MHGPADARRTLHRAAARGLARRSCFGLTKVGGEWRVELPAGGFGLWLDNDQFNRVFAKRFIYYVAPNDRDLVPDSALVPDRDRVWPRLWPAPS